MEQNEINSAGSGNTESSPNPKPLKKLVKANKRTFQEYPPVNEEYHGLHEADSSGYHGKYEAAHEEYHGKYEAAPEEYHGRYEAAPVQSEYRGKHEAAPYKGRYEAESPNDEEYYDYEEEAPRSEKSVKDIVVKTVAIAASFVLICGLILNMPIFVDKKTGGNVSLIYLVKHATPMDKEGPLDKENLELNINTEVVTPDYNDGLDLPQLIEGQFSILFLGFEPDEYNTDVMWVIQLDIGHGKMNILQIPRDCCLPDYTSSASKKFNSIYTLGNPNVNPPIQRVVNAVQENFGIPIDAYVTTTCPDVVSIVDIIGGIPIHLDNEIDFEPSAPGTKLIPAGDIVLTGEQSEWFIRFRSGWLNGDIGRVQNQRRFMAAAMMKMFDIVENQGKLKLYSYIKQIMDEDLLYTDLSIDDMSKIADFCSTLEMENVQVNMVPGEDAWFYADDGIKYSVYSVHKQATIDMLNKYYRPYQIPMTEYDTSIVELVLDYEHNIYDDTGVTFEELEDATEPQRS